MKEKYFLGQDEEAQMYYLIAPSWDCGWYWGFGYVQSRDSHRHADGEFNSTTNHLSDKNIFTGDFLKNKSFNDRDGWILRELMATFYQLKAEAALYGRGGMHVTTNPLQDKLIDTKRADHINKVMIPQVTKAITDILTIK